MKIVLKAIFLFSVIFSPWLVEKVSACSYEYIPSVYQSYKNSTVVFTGKVVGEKVVADERIFRFEIKEAFKGLKMKEVEINNGRQNMCEYGFLIGESYLIYANGKDEKSLYSFNFATRNSSLNYAEDQIHFLRELLKGKPEAQVYGSVIRSDNNSTTNLSRNTNLQGIKIVVEGNGKRFESVTDANGIYYFNKILPGKYTIKPMLPDTYDSYFPGQESFLVLNSGRVATDLNAQMILDNPAVSEQIEKDFLSQGRISDGAYNKFSVHWNNKVKGKVLDAEGKEMSADVRLLPVSNPFQKIAPDHRNEFGKYSIVGSTPARYYLVAEINAPFIGRDKARYFYPQSETPEKATVININETDNLEFDLNVPVIRRKIEGKVYWSDETPIAGDVRIVLSKSENSTDDELRKNNYGVRSLNGESYFSLDGYVGAEYWIHILVFAENVVNEEIKSTRVKTNPVKVKVEKTNEPLKILIPKPDKQAN